MPERVQHRGEWIAGAAMTVSAVAALGLFPLMTDFSYSTMTRAKWLGLLGLWALALACAVTAVLALWTARQGRQIRWHPVSLLALGYLAWVGVSAWLGPLGHQLNERGEWVWWMGAVRYEGMAAKLCYVLLMFCLSLYPQRWRATLGAAALALGIFCGVVALQYLGRNPLGLFPAGRSIYTNYEFQGTIGNIDMVSGYVSLVMPMLLAGYVLLPGRGWHLLAGAGLGMLLTLCMEVQSGLIVMGFALLWTVGYALCHGEKRRRCLLVLAVGVWCLGLRMLLRLPWLDGGSIAGLRWSSAGAVLLLAGVLLALAAWRMGRPTAKAPRSLRPRTVVLLAVLLGLAMLLALRVAKLPESMGGLYELSEILHGRVQDSFGSYRLGVWRNTLLMAREHLWTGTGPNTFVYAMYQQLQQEGLSYPETFDSAHNQYLTILAENGLPGLMFYVAFLVGALWLGMRRARQTPLLWLTTLPLACYALQDVFSFSICLVAPMFWAVAGMHLAALGKNEQGNRGELS